MSNDRKVIFRRIRGRLVPIKVKNSSKQRNDILKGAGLIGGGIGLTVGAEALSGAILGRGTRKVSSKIFAARDLIRTAQVNFSLGKEGPGLLGRAAKLSLGPQGAFSQLRRITRAASFVKAGGALLGVGLAGAGINKISETFAKQDTGATGQILSHLVGTGIAVLGARSLRKGLKFGLGKKSGFKVKKDSQLEFKFDTGQQF